MKRHISIFAFLLGAFAAVKPLTAHSALQFYTYGIQKPSGDKVDSTLAESYFSPLVQRQIIVPDLPLTVSVNTGTPGWTVDCWLKQFFKLIGDYREDAWERLDEGVSDDKSKYTFNDTDMVRNANGWFYVAVKFRHITYDLAYDPAGGTLTSTGGTYSYDTQFQLAEAPSRTGYTFGGWLASPVGRTFAAGETVSGTNLCPDTWHEVGNKVTMTAQWAEKTYGISTSGENCTVTVSKSSGVGYTEVVTISWDPQTPQGHSRRLKSAKVLAGETELKSFSSGTSGTFTMSTANKGYFENVTVRVVYEDTTNQYQVNVTSGGNGSVSKDPNQSRYDYGSTVRISATPNEGYAFASWSDGGAQTHDVTVGAADVTYTATFTNRVYMLTWDANGGKFADGSSVSNVLIAYDSPLGDLPLPTRDRMDRDGWHTEESGGNVVDSDTRYTWNYDRTLYMHWQESHLYKIKTVASPEEGGTAEGDGELATGETTTLKATPNEGYSFKSWSDGGAQTHDVTVGLADVTYTATFTGNTYKVYFKLEDASGEEYDGNKPKAIERTYGDVYGELPPPTLDDETLEFVCWTDGDGNEITPKTRVSGGEPVKKRIDLCVSVRRRLFYTVTFDGEGATSGSMDAQKIYRDEETALSSNAFRWTGHAFLGWAETNNLGRAKYADGTNILNIAKAGDTNELHAVWSANTYTVGFLPGGATGTMEDQPFVYDRPQALRDCTFNRGDPALWSFAGWTNSAAGGPLYTNHETVVNLTADPGGRVELTAVWKSELSDLALAMGCDNLNWTNTTTASVWKAGNVDFYTTDIPPANISCVYASGSVEAIMRSSNFTTNGVLHFWWKATGPRESLSFKSSEQGLTNWRLDGGDDSDYTDWHETNIVVNCKSDGDIAYFSFSHLLRKGMDPEGDFTCWIAKMTWTPGGPEPVDGKDNVTISSAAVSADGKSFSLSFDSKAEFDYNLLTNANLLIKEGWGVMEKKTGTGEPITFEPKIIEGQPQMFYRVDTIQRK